MFCPKCAIEYELSYSRCPECSSWLYPERPILAKDTTDSSEPFTMNDKPMDIVPDVLELGSGVSLPATPLPVSTTTESTEIPAVNTAPPDLPPGSSEPRTPSIDPPLWEPPEPSPQLVALGQGASGPNYSLINLGLLSLVLVAALVYGMVRIINEPVASTEESQVKLGQSSDLKAAETWLESAKESFQTKDYELAISQYKEGIELLGKGQADPEAINTAKLELAKTYQIHGDLENSHAIWLSLSSQEQAATKLQELEKALRLQGQEKLGQARERFRERDFNLAREKAYQAFQIFEKYRGSSQQKALSLDLSGRCHLAEENTLEAETDLKKAQLFEKNEDRGRLLASVVAKTRIGPIELPEPTLEEQPFFEQRVVLDSPPREALRQQVQRRSQQRQQRRANLGQGSEVPRGILPGEPGLRRRQERRNQREQAEYEEASENGTQNEEQPSQTNSTLPPPIEFETEDTQLGRKGVLDTYSQPRTDSGGIPGL